ncbi:shikimate dehydrogenase [Mucilaginibacter sp. RS28]|uniref:Shikimate dehydrogenase n=1 Tax=Mucilaginibacter straminoryzae TaxID=2932774 RepID=A0A9X2B9X9_9SPHI|nr:shikimate dehydrogenase [Mucilaginibacter straminoryzae]MCJ8210886.1 shikimate dehydrogenase [Mucilaginibacter straminoryzae]
MKKYGLIGYPLSHSFSKKFFTDKFREENIEDTQYDLYPLENIKELLPLLERTPDLCGLNVTIPYKVEVMELLDWRSTEAKQIGAVNCLRIANQSPVTTVFTGEVGFKDDHFRIEGFNTDAYGFEESLKPLLKSQHERAMILGDGGAAQAVKYVLQTMGMPYMIVARKPGENRVLFDELTAEHVQSHKLIINTTPLGTSPNIDACPPIPYEAIGDEHLLYDLVYNPEVTLFLQKGQEQGATIKNGYEMLVLQAEKSWEIWNSKAVHI